MLAAAVPSHHVKKGARLADFSLALSLSSGKSSNVQAGTPTYPFGFAMRAQDAVTNRNLPNRPGLSNFEPHPHAGLRSVAAGLLLVVGLELFAGPIHRSTPFSSAQGP